MQNTHSMDDLLAFLAHAGERGLMPAATAQALAVATRNVLGVLSAHEREQLPLDDLDGVIRRFTNKRAREFTPASLKEYARRLRRAVELYLQWSSDPANFSVKTRATSSASAGRNAPARSPRDARALASAEGNEAVDAAGQGRGVTVDTTERPLASESGYRTTFPIRPGHLVTITNVPVDLTSSEAERLAQFIRLLAPS